MNNTRIYLYNEDGYTLWALVERLPQLLQALGDSTHPNSTDIHIFYRPSFGRADDVERRQFGEPDILLGTPERVYHIECKPKLTGSRRKTLELKPAQVLRHSIFQTYRRLWQQHHPETWHDFHTAASLEFEQAHNGRKMALPRHLLGHNLEFILRTLEKSGPEVCDTLLVFQRAETAKQWSDFTNPHGFRSIVLPLEMVAESNFVGVWMTQPLESHNNQVVLPVVE